jgi:hypothetical protein
MTYGISCSTLPDNVKLYLKPVSFSAYVMKHMLVDVDGKSKFCLKCGSRATKEAFFDVDGAMLIENTATHVQRRKQNRSRNISP